MKPFSEDPEDAPVEVDPAETEREEEDADEAEIKAAAPKEITFDDVADIHYNKKGEQDGYQLCVTKAAYSLARKMSIKMSEDSPDIYRFNGEIYKPDGSRLADMTLCSLLGDAITIVKFKEVERRIKNTLLSSPIKFEPNPYLLAVKNGVVDLRTGEFRGFREEDLLLEKLDITYDKNARCPAFCDFMTSATNVIVDRLTLIDWFAAHAIKVPIPYVLFLLGLGRNGKGIYEKLLKEFYGQCSFRDFALDAPEKNNFAASALYRKRGWVAAESKTSKQEPTIGTEFMKLITGNGVIDGDRKNIGRIVFEPYTQITVDTNTMPRVNDRSVGWEERLAKINLPYLFLEKLVPGDPQVKIADPDLFEKLTTPSELSGILNLVLYRAKEICKTKRITKRSGKEMVKEYSEQSSSMETFLNEFCEYDAMCSGLLQPFTEVFEAFEAWCQLTVSEKVDSGYFGKQLKRLCGNIAPKREKKAVGTIRVNVTSYRGLIFDTVKYKAVIEKLQAGFKEANVSSVSGMSQAMSQENNGLLIALSPVSPVNQWNTILKKFSYPYIEKETPDLLETRGTLGTTATGDIEKVSQVMSQGNPDSEALETSESDGSPGGVPVVGAISLPVSETDRIRAGHQKHVSKKKSTCHICNRTFPYELTPDISKEGIGYICTSCHMGGAPAEPPKAEAQQTSLA